MDWLLYSMLYTFTSTLVLAFAFLLLFKLNNEKFLLVWAISWIISSFRYFFLFLVPYFDTTTFIFIGGQFSILFGALFFLIGTFGFLERRIPKWIIGFCILDVLFILSHISFEYSLIISTLPTMLFACLIYICTGILLFNLKEYNGIGRYILGGSLVLWGINKIVFPYIIQIEWLRPWDSVLVNALIMLCFLGLVIMYFQKTKGELSQIEDKFTKAFHSNPSVMTISTIEEDRIIEINDAFTKNLGFSRDEVIGKTTKELDLFVDADIRNQLIRLMRENGRISNFEIEVRSQNGELKKGITSAEIIKVKDRQYFLTVTNDITEMRKAVEALKLSELKYKTTIDSISDAIHVVDNNLNIILINDTITKWHEKFGLEKNIIGMNLFDVYTFLKEEVRDEYEKVINENRIIRTEEINIVSGVEVLTETMKIPLKDEEKTVGIITVMRDITERIKAEKEIRENERLFRRAIEANDSIPYYLDYTDFSYSFIGDGIEKITGYPADEFTPELWRSIVKEVIPLGDLKGMPPEEAIAEVMEGRHKNWRSDNKLMTPEGEEIWLSDGSVAIFDDNRDLIGALGMLVDITERKNTEKELERMQNQIEQFSKTTVSLIEETDEIEFFNAISRSISKYSDYKRVTISLFKEEAPFRDIVAYSGIDKETIKRLRKVDMQRHWFEEIFEKGIRIGKFTSYIPHTMKDILNPEGTIFGTGKKKASDDAWHPEDNLFVKMLDRQGNLIGLISIDDSKSGKKPTDETVRPLEIFSSLISSTIINKKAEEELKKSEEKYREVVDHIDVIIFQLNMEGKLIYVSPASERILGFKHEEIIGSSYLNFIHPDDVNMIKNAFRRSLTESIDSIEYRIKHISGEFKWVHTSTRQLIVDNEIVGIQGLIVDFTDRKIAEEEKQKLEEHLIQVQKMESIGRLAGGIAHDFNNMLTSIMGYAELLSLQFPDKDSSTGEAVSVILDRSEKAAEMTQQLLGFARKGKFDPEPVNLNMIIRESVNVSEKIFDKNIEVKYEFEDELRNIEADRTQIDQVLTNLIINARDAMPEGGKLEFVTESITIDEKKYKKVPGISGEYIKLEVKDNGCGMPKKIREKIFEPFFTTKGKDKGTGLGLATVYSIVNNHSGHIFVESEPDVGTTFTILLPATDKKISNLSKPDKLIKGNAKILIVDDEKQVRTLLRSMLKELGYISIEAGDGLEAIDIYKEKKGSIDIVLLDMIMPNLPGKETFYMLKQIDPDVKVMLVSGYSQDSKASDLIKDGVKGFIQKPVRLGQLSECINKILN